MPQTPFAELDHTAQLDLLEQLTRTVLHEHYDIAGPAPTFEVQQFEDNAVWRVRAGDSSYVARLSIRDGRPAHQQRSEMRWLESLAASGQVAVPEPVTTTIGHYVVPIEVPGHDQPATLAVLRWLHGTAEPPYRQPGVAADMGAATAALHKRSSATGLRYRKVLVAPAKLALRMRSGSSQLDSMLSGK
ncbi:hypothetical protein HLB23_14250 [Nocardia uniformis]|uniref:Aminoglycoside phosphotransferase domain-containing protein n=1 Tax=Nocardia uniformis TaxID=53432 RepID=A0A849CD72_9NOCA|nr:phosphotransferase [Nocardia uniformis]NNH71011.1 hypothetical protein [Nocardia uniformis]